MKFIRIPIIMLASVAIFSCSQDDSSLQDENVVVENISLDEDLSTYRNSALGLYKGVFSTADSQSRATVEVQIVSEADARATFIDTDGVVEFYEGTLETEESGSNQVTFAFASQTSSFKFSVGTDGQNPIIENAVSNNKPSFVTVLKENTRDAVTPVTGSFMGTNGITGTWSVIFNSGDDEGDNMDITTMSIFDGTDFGSPTGSAQSSCVAVGNKTDCVIGGNYVSQGLDITWAGTHTFLNSIDCSSITGTWSTDNGNSGTFMGDSNCNGTGEVIITEIHNRPQRPSADEMQAAIPNNPGSPGNDDLRSNGEGQELHAEWFEVFNTTDSPVDMSGWVFTDASGGSRTFTVSSFVLGAGEYAAFTGYNIPAAHGGHEFDYIYTYNEMSFNNESSYSPSTDPDTGEVVLDDNCPDGIIITNDSGVLVDQVLYDYGYGSYLGNAESNSSCRDNDVAIGLPAQGSNSRVSFQLINNPAVMNSDDNDDAANWSFSTQEYDSDNGQDGTPGSENDEDVI